MSAREQPSDDGRANKKRKRRADEDPSSPSPSESGDETDGRTRVIFPTRDADSDTTIEDFVKCPICYSFFVDPYSTPCGHTFCCQCIEAALEVKKTCPTCEAPCSGKKDRGLVPNTLVEEMSRKVQAANKCNKVLRDGESLFAGLSGVIQKEKIQDLINTLSQLQEYNETAEKNVMKRVIGRFMVEIYQKHQDEIRKLRSTMNFIRDDCGMLGMRPFPLGTSAPPSRLSSENPQEVPQSFEGSSDQLSSLTCLDTLYSGTDETIEEVEDNTPVALERRYTIRALRNFDSLNHAYNNIRVEGNAIFDSENIVEESIFDTPIIQTYEDMQPKLPHEARLPAFEDYFSNVCRYGGAHLVGKLNYDIEPQSSMSIVSSLEFDRDGELFVVAGVTKKIKVFNFDHVMDSVGHIHTPETQLTGSSKISCVVWNPFHKNILACTDYEGVVNLWDVRTSQPTKKYHEHTKRCWSVAFSTQDPLTFASGSDDTKVKVWNTSSPNALITIDGKVNVCCVSFAPTNSYELVFGCADHAVHVYDLRNASRPRTKLEGHSKAVSYVRYTEEGEIVSASTDNSLRVWDLKSEKCVKVIKGHQNEKNFVGLSGNRNYLVCGSENNRAYFYYKKHADPLFLFDMSTLNSVAPSNVYQRVPGPQLNVGDLQPSTSEMDMSQQMHQMHQMNHMNQMNQMNQMVGQQRPYAEPEINFNMYPERRPVNVYRPSPMAMEGTSGSNSPAPIEDSMTDTRTPPINEPTIDRSGHVMQPTMIMNPIRTMSPGMQPVLQQPMPVSLPLPSSNITMQYNYSPTPIQTQYIPHMPPPPPMISGSVIVAQRSMASAAAVARAQARHSTNSNDFKGFVSSVCWRPQTNNVLVANSCGKVYILKIA